MTGRAQPSSGADITPEPFHKLGLQTWAALAFGLVVIGLGLALLVNSEGPEEPPPNWRIEIERAVLQVMPPGAQSCGFVGLGEDRTEARRCMDETEQVGVDHWVASQAQGEDSVV